MRYTFSADIEALETAARSIGQVLEDKWAFDIEDFLPSAEAVGSDVVWEAISEFSDRWETGINAMADDVESISGALSAVAANYRAFEESRDKALARIEAAVAVIQSGSGVGQ